MNLPPNSPMYSWPELFARLALTTKPTVSMTDGGTRVQIVMNQVDSALLIEELDRRTRENA